MIQFFPGTLTHRLQHFSRADSGKRGAGDVSAPEMRVINTFVWGRIRSHFLPEACCSLKITAQHSQWFAQSSYGKSNFALSLARSRSTAPIPAHMLLHSPAPLLFRPMPSQPLSFFTAPILLRPSLYCSSSRNEHTLFSSLYYLSNEAHRAKASTETLRCMPSAPEVVRRLSSPS